jgi:hypothetical protein
MREETVTVLDRVPVDSIVERAAQVHLGRLLLTLFVGVFFVIGWSGRMAFRGLAFCVAAIQVGWQEAAPKPRERR